MKLVTFEVTTALGRYQRLGALVASHASKEPYYLDLNAAYQWWLTTQDEPQPQQLAEVVVPPTMLGFIEAGPKALTAARQLLAEVEAGWNLNEPLRYKGPLGQTLLYHPSQVKLKAPLPNPPSLKDFIAFEAHVKRGYEIRGKTLPEQWYKQPIYYKGNHRTIIGPDEPIIWPSYTQKLDYELELGCIIGKSGENIPEDQAQSYIFGFTILNDYSARDIQFAEMQCRLGPAKGKDFATAIGPYIATLDEFDWPVDLTMTALVNGEPWSKGQSGTSHWSWSQIIAYASLEEAIYPGDILGSGTVGGGCGYELDRWIQPDDVVELQIEGLGHLRNTVLTHETAQRAGLSAKAESLKGDPHVHSS